MLSKTLSKLISRGPPFNDQGGGLADRRPVAWVTGFQPPACRTASRRWLRRSSHRPTSALMRFSTSRALIFEGGSARLKFRFHLLKGGLRSLQRTFSPLTVLRIRRFLFAALRLPGALRFLIGPAPRSVGTSDFSSNGPICADGTFEHDAWVGKRCRHRLCVRDFLGKALMEKIAARTPGFERGLHRRHGYREVLNPCDVWYVLRFLAIRRVSSGGRGNN